MGEQAKNRRRERVWLCLWVIALGVASRAMGFESAVVNKYAGDSLYAILLYLVIGILIEGRSLMARGGMAFAALIGIEVFQLTQIPLKLSRSDSVVPRYVAVLLGTAFSWRDILAYGVGIIAIVSYEKARYGS
jgi:hypothetical protein